MSLWDTLLLTPGNKVRNQSSFDSPGGWKWHHFCRHPTPGFPTCTVGITDSDWNLPPQLLLSLCNSEKCLALSSLYLPRQQLSLSQPFPMLHFPACTTLDLTDPPPYLCVPSSSPHPLCCKVQPQSKQRRKRSFPSACWCPGTQSGMWLPTGQHHRLMFTQTSEITPQHLPASPTWHRLQSETVRPPIYLLNTSLTY